MKRRDVSGDRVGFRLHFVLDLGFVLEAVRNALRQEGSRQVLRKQELERESVLSSRNLSCESVDWDFHSEERLFTLMRLYDSSGLRLAVHGVRFRVSLLKQTVFFAFDFDE